jgi:signal peptidase I
MTTSSTSNKEPWLAVTLSKIFPGIGQIYAGRVVKGWILIAVSVLQLLAAGWFLFSPTGNTLVAANVLVIFFCFTIWNLFDAHKCTRRNNHVDFEQLRRQSKDPWLAVFLSQFIPGIGHIYLGKWFFAILWIALWIALIFGLLNNILLIELVSISFSIFAVYHAYISSPSRRESSLKLIRKVCFLLLFVVLLSVLLDLGARASVEPRYFTSSSMEPTLKIDDRMLVEKISYRFRKPSRGEIIMFYPPDNPEIPNTGKANVFVKRIIGVPGDAISIRDGKVLINRQALKEVYIEAPTAYELPTNDPNLCLHCFQPEKISEVNSVRSFTVPSDLYWVMGDNRNNSFDSHIWGFLPEANIVGRVYARYWPVDGRTRDLTIPQN